MKYNVVYYPKSGYRIVSAAYFIKKVSPRLSRMIVEGEFIVRN